jgi:hypothetical protein
MNIMENRDIFTDIGDHCVFRRFGNKVSGFEENKKEIQNINDRITIIIYGIENLDCCG